MDAERSVLGAVLLDNAALGSAAEALVATDFFLGQHRRIFAQMLTLREIQIPIDLVTLTEALHQQGNLEAAGGAPYISQLADGMPRVSNVEHYAGIVKQKAVLRQVIHTAHALEQGAFDATDGPDAILSEAQTRIDCLRQLVHNSGWNGKFHRVEELAKGEPEWILDGYVEEGLSFLGAKSGVAKTWLGIAEGKALRTGEKLLGVFGVPKQRNVLYLIPEMTERRFRNRCEKLGVDIHDQGFLVRTMNDGAPLPLNDAALRSCVEKLQPVIWLDTAVRFAAGKEENSAAEVSSGLIAATYQLIQLGSPAVRALHHRAKDASDDELTLENVLRGSGDFGAGAVCVWGAAHETARRAGKLEECDTIGRKKPDNHTRQTLEREYLQESRRLGRCYLECVKPGDRELILWDFRIQLRPSIDVRGEIEMLTAVFPAPSDKGIFIDEQLSRTTRRPERSWAASSAFTERPLFGAPMTAAGSLMKRPKCGHANSARHVPTRLATRTRMRVAPKPETTPAQRVPLDSCRYHHARGIVQKAPASTVLDL